MKDNYVKQILLMPTIIVVSVALHYFSNDYTALTTTTYLYLFTAVVPVLNIFLFAFKKGGIFSETFNMYLIPALLFFAVVYSTIMFIYSKFDDNSLFLLGSISNILLVLRQSYPVLGRRNNPHTRLDTPH